MDRDSLASSTKRHWLFKPAQSGTVDHVPSSAASSSERLPGDFTVPSSTASSSRSIQSSSFQPRASNPKRHWLFELPRLSEAREQPARAVGDEKCPKDLRAPPPPVRDRCRDYATHTLSVHPRAPHFIGEHSMPIKNTFIHYDKPRSFNWWSAPAVMMQGSFHLKVTVSQVTAVQQAAHDSGECQPCIYHRFKPDGCRLGTSCSFCHICERGDVRKKRKDRKHSQREVLKEQWLKNSQSGHTNRRE